MMKDFHLRLQSLLDGLAASGCDEAWQLLQELNRRLAKHAQKQRRLHELDQMDAHGEKPSGRPYP